jgi:hypothetical protein
MVYLFDRPAIVSGIWRMNAWLRARRSAAADAPANAYFTATITGDAVSHIGENFSAIISSSASADGREFAVPIDLSALSLGPDGVSHPGRLYPRLSAGAAGAGARRRLTDS